MLSLFYFTISRNTGIFTYLELDVPLAMDSTWAYMESFVHSLAKVMERPRLSLSWSEGYDFCGPP